MKKWISLMTAVACMFSSSACADDVIDHEDGSTYSNEAAALPDAPSDTEETQPPKEVGKVSADAANAARSSIAAKYVLAAGAVAIGVAALILVSRHHGHRH